MVSIIIATYNSGATLKRALESVKTQHYDEWECIIVDGDSSDNTIDIVKLFQFSDNRFRYISEKDNGIYDALNKGIKLAKGEWIYVLGSDDVLTKDGIESLINHAKNEDDIIYGNVFTINPSGKIGQSYSKKYTCLNHTMMGSHQGMIMRKNIIEKLNGFNCLYKIWADFDLVQRAYLNHCCFSKVNTFVAYFNMTGLSNSQRLFKDTEKYHILRNNSVRYSLLWYIYEETKLLIKHILKIW